MTGRQMLTVLSVVWVGISMYLVAGGLRGARGKVEHARQQQLEAAVWAVEANADGMSDAGYVRWTPTTMAQQLVPLLNAATTSPADDVRAGETLPRPFPPILYVLGHPTGTWQVVLVPEEARNTIRVEAYAIDPARPLIVREITVGD